MRLVLLICEDDSPQQHIKQHLPDRYVLLQKGFDQAGLQALKEMVAGIVLVDAEDPRIPDWLKKAWDLRQDLTFVGAAGKKDQIQPEVEDMLSALVVAPFRSRDIARVLDKEWERIRLVIELQALKRNVGYGTHRERAEAGRGGWTGPGVGAAGAGSARIGPEGTLGSQAAGLLRRKEQILCEFSRALSSSFNRDRLLGLFLDTVIKLIPVGRLSIVLQGDEPGKYRIFSQKGLSTTLCARLSFDLDKGLMSWLSDQGRILLKEEATAWAGEGDTEVAQELKLLQAAVSIPLQAHGHLCGSLNLGPKVTGAPFNEEELEMLFILSGNVAIALRDIDLHHQVLFQNSYIENILQRMGSGLVAISSEEKITTCNSRALELLAQEEGALLGKDLRRLPSPLGDILFETMRTGREYHKQEFKLAGRGIYLEVSTNQLVSKEGSVLGSVMIFDDVSQRKQLEQEKRHTDRLDVLNRFVGQLAHEIKNPMVAIQTFTELLPEKYEERAFREFFNHTVRQEVKRLNELVEQLIAFSSPLSYRFSVTEAHEILDRGLSLLREQGKGEATSVETSYFNGEAFFKADPELLPRALSYLLRSSFEVLEKGGKLYIETRPDPSQFAEGGLRILFRDGVSKVSGSQLEALFDPLSAQQGDHISLELPVSKKIIEDHGGTVKTSTTKEGCLVFEVLMPLISPEGSDGVEEP